MILQKSAPSNCKPPKDKKTPTQQAQRPQIVNQQNPPQTPYRNISHHHQKKKSKGLIAKSL